jgi:hypothetical protein
MFGVLADDERGALTEKPESATVAGTDLHHCLINIHRCIDKVSDTDCYVP